MMQQHLKHECSARRIYRGAVTRPTPYLSSYVIVHDCGVEGASEYYYLGRLARRNEAFIPLRRLNE